jgi:hypothetical protein
MISSEPEEYERREFLRLSSLLAAASTCSSVLPNANDNLAEAYLKDGQKDLARQHAERALALLDSHAGPASSWADTEQFRGEIRSQCA